MLSISIPKHAIFLVFVPGTGTNPFALFATKQTGRQDMSRVSYYKELRFTSRNINLATAPFVSGSKNKNKQTKQKQKQKVLQK